MSDTTDRADVVRRSVDTERDEPGAQIANIVAELEDEDPTELSAMWNCIDDVLANLFDDPPSSEAQMRVSFSYEGYRITVDQDGAAELVPGEAA